MQQIFFLMNSLKELNEMVFLWKFLTKGNLEENVLRSED